MEVKRDLYLDEEYAKTGLWLYDTPVHQPNYYCSRCQEKLLNSVTVNFTIERFNKMPLEFEYHKGCLINALIQSIDAMKQGLLKFKEKAC